MIVKDDSAADFVDSVDDIISKSGVVLDSMPLESANQLRALVGCFILCGLVIRWLSPVGGKLHA